jgi:NADPH:quinone reductase-like Zn-dependent oxidoreductase
MKTDGKTMRAIALNKFGGPQEMVLQNIPVPEVGPDEVLIKVEYAGIGTWDQFEREGGYAELTGIEPRFPYILGSEGAGTVEAVGERVIDIKPGDKVFAAAFLNPKGGFYAEYTVVDQGLVSIVPDYLSVLQASIVGGVGITALRGIEDTLRLKPGENAVILGASGGIGHIAVQIAKSFGARVLAIASRNDGTALVRSIGAQSVIDGRADNIAKAVSEFAPGGSDAALLTAGGEAAEAVTRSLRPGGRVAFPNGIYPVPEVNSGIEVLPYNGEPDREIIQRLNALIVGCKIKIVHVDRVFPLTEVIEAHKALNEHYIGKLALKI